MLVSAIVLAAGVAAATCTPTIPNGSQPPDEVLYSPAFSEGRLAEARLASGCWQITARTRGSALTLVIDVELADAP